MTILAGALSALLLLIAAIPAAAGPIVDAATRAEALHAEAKTVEALEALDEAVEVIWRDGPLAFRTVAVVNSPGSEGVFDERTDLNFSPDEKMMIYVEPVGFGYRSPGASSTVGFTADLAIENTTGQVFGEAKNLFSVSADTAAGKREFGMTLSFAVPYLRPGEYKAIVTVHDQNSDKSGEFEVAFNIGLPTTESAEEASD